MTWKDYQDEASEFFRGLGMAAKCDQTIQGVRTKHDVDVLVTTEYAGFTVTWIVECKQWKNRVSKLHVLALREIVHDAGADRGILLSEIGFQSGAQEAAHLTNVQITSLSDCRLQSEHIVGAMRLRDLFDRMEVCKSLYWDLPKVTRIKHGLRPDVTAPGYSGTTVLSASEELLSKGLRGQFPFKTDSLGCFALGMPDSVVSSKHVVDLVQPMLEDLECRLRRAAQP